MFILKYIAAWKNNLDRLPILWVFFAVVEIFSNNWLWANFCNSKWGIFLECVCSNKIVGDDFFMRMNCGDVDRGVKKSEVFISIT